MTASQEEFDGPTATGVFEKASSSTMTKNHCLGSIHDCFGILFLVFTFLKNHHHFYFQKPRKKQGFGDATTKPKIEFVELGGEE